MERDWIMLLLQHESQLPLGQIGIQEPMVAMSLTVQKIYFEITSYDNFARQFNSWRSS